MCCPAGAHENPLPGSWMVLMRPSGHTRSFSRGGILCLELSLLHGRCCSQTRRVPKEMGIPGTLFYLWRTEGVRGLFR